MVDLPAGDKGTKGMWPSIVEAAHERIAGALAANKTAQQTAMLERFESDLAPVIGPIVEHLLSNPALPDELRGLFTLIGSPEHFGESVVIGIAIGSIVSPVIGAALGPIVQGITNTAWSAAVTSNPLGARPLSPDLLAAAVLKGVLTESQAAVIAHDSGTDDTAFHTMVMTAGQAIGIEQAILLWRRGDITSTELARVVHYSNVRDDFLPDIELLKYLPPPAGEVVSGALKGHLSDTVAMGYLSDAGIDPTKHYDWMKHTAGRSLGLMEMLTLWNRGEMTEAEVRLGIEQSDINNDYIGYAELLRVHYPAVFQVHELVKAGAMTPARATTILGYEGFQPEDIAAIVAEFNTAPKSTVKELSASQVTKMYEEQLLSQGDALARLETLKYTAADAQLMLTYADQNRALAMINAAAKKIGTLYVAHKITQTTAAAQLTAAGVPNAAAMTMFKFWDLERAANVRIPSEAQVVGAYRRKEIGAADCKARLLNMGVQQGDLAIFVADGWPPTKPATAAIIDAVVNA